MFTLRSTPRALAVTGLVGALALGACSGDDTPTGSGGGGGGAAGSFTVDVTGGVTGSFSGSAVQAETPVDPSTGQQGWVIFLGSASGTADGAFIVRAGSRPGTGSYSVADLNTSTGLTNDQWGALITLGSGTSLAFLGLSVSGSITITSSSADRVEGTLDFQVTGSDPSNPQQQVTATVTGNFSAVGSTVNFPGF